MVSVNGQCLGIAGGVVAVVGILVWWFSFASLELTEYGIDFSMISYNINRERVFTNGRHMLGLGHYFIRFPSRQQSISYSNAAGSAAPALRSRTSDGLEVTLELSFQYRIIQGEVIQLYDKYGTSYEDVYIQMGIDSVTAQATEHDASTFFADRILVINNMTEALEKSFENAHSSIENIQLTTVSLPTAFQDAIQATEVAKQDKETAEAERKNQEVEALTRALKAQRDARQVVINAEADATTIKLNTETYVKQFALSQQLQAEGFLPLYEKLGRNESLLLQYLDVRALRDHASANTVVNIGQNKMQRTAAASSYSR
jgi:regulator of protease activity HflC (stomatin/prohibitin superfamily)